MACFVLMPAVVNAKQSAVASRIKRCVQATQSSRDSGITSKMVQGESRYRQCLLNVLSNTLSKKSIREQKTVKQVSQIARKIELTYLTYYCNLDQPGVGCGTMYIPMAKANGNAFIMDFLKSVEEHQRH